MSPRRRPSHPGKRPPDAWPFDFDDNQRASLGDALRYLPRMNKYPPDPAYEERYDLNASGGTTLADVLKYIAVMNTFCTP